MSRTNLLAWLGALGVAAAGCSLSTEQVDGVGMTASALSAAPELIAIGGLAGDTADRSRETAALLENGQPGNLLGGIGSGLAFVAGQKFLALPDRGPNATPYQPGVDDTTSYIPRFHTLSLQLTRSSAGSALPYTLTPSLKDTTLLSTKEVLTYGSGSTLALPNGAPLLNTKRQHYFSGRSDNFDATQPSTFGGDGRLDPEGVRVSRDGKHVFVSDEYGPYVYEFDKKSGKRTRVFALPAEFAIANLSAQGALEISGNTSGRVSNKGMEGLAVSPDGSTLIGMMQSPLAQDGGTDGRFTRIVTIQIETGAIEQFAYELTNIGTAVKPKYPTVSEIVAINDHEFLVDERDGKGLGDNSSAVYKKIYRIDLSNAEEVSGIHGDPNLAGKAVAKTLFIDVVAALTARGFAVTDIPAKIEGMAFGPDVRSAGATKHTLYLSTDNDFLATITDSNHPAGIDNPNRFFVFAIDPAALPAFQQQQCDDASD